MMSRWWKRTGGRGAKMNGLRGLTHPKPGGGGQKVCTRERTPLVGKDREMRRGGERRRKEKGERR